MLAVPQSPFTTSNAKIDDLRVPTTPEQSVSHTIKSLNTDAVGTGDVFDKLLETKSDEGRNDSFGFDDSGWNTSIEDEDLGIDAVDETPVVHEKNFEKGSLGAALPSVPMALGKTSTTDQPSAVSCLTDDGSDCPPTPSRKVTLRSAATVSSVFAPTPPLQLEEDI